MMCGRIFPEYIFQITKKNLLQIVITYQIRWQLMVIESSYLLFILRRTTVGASESEGVDRCHTVSKQEALCCPKGPWISHSPPNTSWQVILTLPPAVSWFLKACNIRKDNFLTEAG